MIIASLKEAAEAVGISAFITNSDEKIDIQLNRLTREEDLPIMLISWDLRATVEFDNNGFVMDPPFDVVCLLLTKTDEPVKDDMEEAAASMATLYINFLQHLNNTIRIRLRGSETRAVFNVNYQLVPKHGSGHHSGILGKFTLRYPHEVSCS